LWPDAGGCADMLQKFSGKLPPQARHLTVIMFTALAAAALSPLPSALLGFIGGQASPYRTEGVSAQTTGFLETFDGSPNSPRVFTSPRWVLMPYSGDGLVTSNPGTSSESISWGPVEAGHGPHCEPPLGNPDPTSNNHLLPPAPQRNANSLLDFQNYVANIV